MKLKVFSFSAVSYLYQYITSIGLFYKNVEGLWSASDFEEIVGGYSQEMMGLNSSF